MKIQPVLRVLAFLVLFGCLMQGALAYKAAGAIGEAVTSMQLSFRSFERSLDQSTTLGDLGEYGQYQRPSQPPRPTPAPKDFITTSAHKETAESFDSSRWRGSNGSRTSISVTL